MSLGGDKPPVKQLSYCQRYLFNSWRTVQLPPQQKPGRRLVYPDPDLRSRLSGEMPPDNDRFLNQTQTCTLVFLCCQVIP
jgi:hypothetical protein